MNMTIADNIWSDKKRNKNPMNFTTYLSMRTSADK